MIRVSDRVGILIVMLVAVAFVAPSVQAGPFLGHEPTTHVVEAALSGAEAASDDAFDLTRATWGVTAEIVNAAQSGRFAANATRDYFHTVGEEGVSAVNGTRDVATAGITGSVNQTFLGVEYGIYLHDLAQQRAGVNVGDGQPPVAAVPGGSCVPGDSLASKLETVLAGDEITVCPGHVVDDLRITTEFVTLRSAQGPFATTISGAVTIEATGVTLAGFTITDGGVTIGGEGDGYTGEIWGTLLYGNIIQGNGVGVEVGHAYATILVGNTIRANGVGVLASSDLADEPAAGVVLALNNLERNGQYAIRSAGVPIVSIGDHHGDPVPRIAVVDGVCVGTGATDTRCRNAAGPGAIVLGFSPVAHPML